MNVRLCLHVCLVLGIVVTAARADDRALIIGIGQGYPSPNNLEGPARDVELAATLAHQLGYTGSQVKILREAEATKAAIIAALQWLNAGITAHDRRFLYYSGHGFRVPTSHGGCMAALVPVDARSRETFLLADEFNQYLQGLRQRAKVVMLIDACFSGGITKQISGLREDRAKYYEDKSGPTCDKPTNLKSLSVVEDTPAAGGQDQLVAMMATGDNEVAFGARRGSGTGSVFTQCLYDLVMGDGERGLSLPFTTLREQTASCIKKVSEQSDLLLYTSQLRGNPVLFQQNLRFASISPAPSDPTGGITGARNVAELFDRLINNS